MPMIIEPRVDAVNDRARALRDIQKRAGEREMAVPRPKNRLHVPKSKCPPGWEAIWPTEETLDNVLELGGKIVDPTDENCERYGIRSEGGIMRSVHNNQPIALKKGEHILCIIPSETLQAIDDAIVLETAHLEVVGSTDETMGFDAFTAAAARTARRDNARGAVDGLSSQIIAKTTDKVAGIKSMVQEAKAEKVEKRARAAKGQPRRKGQGGRSINDVISAKGMDRSEIIPAV